jgi:hypothetical protein
MRLLYDKTQFLKRNLAETAGNAGYAGFIPSFRRILPDFCAVFFGAVLISENRNGCG